MASKAPSDLNRALAAMRCALDWKQSELARATGLRGTTISDFERGNRAFSLEKLTELASVLGLPPGAVAQSRAFVRSMAQQAQPPGHPGEDAGADRRKIEQVAVLAGTLTSDFTRSLLELVTFEARSLTARQQARLLWQRMEKRSPARRRNLVEKNLEFHSWALCELICKESIRAAADNADRARELAELALLIADLATGAETWRWRLQGYAWAHVGNARRVGGDLPGAEKAFVRANKLWEKGAPGDPGLLDEAQVLSLEASLRISQCRFPEAAALLGRALASAPEALKPNLFIKRAKLLEWTGDYEGALTVLGEADHLITEMDDPRRFWMLRFHFANNLIHLGRYGEAEVLLPEIRKLTARLDNELDSLRLCWLEGRIAAGLKKTTEALVALSQVRTKFVARGIIYDAALVTMELAVLYLEEGRNQEVKTLTRQMAPIFQVEGVHREALAALKLFREAVERETASVEWVRQVAKYLYRARNNPSLRFEVLP